MGVLKTHKDVLFEGSDYQLDLSKIVDKKILAVTGYVTTEFEDPVFKLSSIKFEDGYEVFVEGEHDLPYICLDEEVMENIHKTDPDYEPEE